MENSNNVFEETSELFLIIHLARPSFDYKSLSESTKFLAENFWQILPTLPISQHSVFFYNNPYLNS